MWFWGRWGTTRGTHDFGVSVPSPRVPHPRKNKRSRLKKNYRDKKQKTMSLQLSQTQKTGSSGSGVKALVADMQQKIAEQDATINILSQRIDEIEREKDRINDAASVSTYLRWIRG